MSTTLLLGDCLNRMKEIPDGSVDLVITDPPYLMNHTTGGTKSIGMSDRWMGNIKAGNSVMGFEKTIRFADWLPETYRILKDSGHCYIFCNDKNVKELLDESSNARFRLSNILVWLKNNATPNRYYMKNCEFILFLYKGRAKPIRNMGTKAVIECQNIRGKDKRHPTEKPTALLSTLIENSSEPGELVVDPFMGSGSTGVAAVNTERNFIGVEISADYYAVAAGRITQAEAAKNMEEDNGQCEDAQISL